MRSPIYPYRPLHLAGTLLLGGLLAAAPLSARADEAAPAAPDTPAAAVPAFPTPPSASSDTGAQAAPAAQTPGSPSGVPNPLEQRVKDLEETVRQLKELIQKQQTAPVPSPKEAPGRPEDKPETKPAKTDNAPGPKGTGIVLQSPDGNNSLRIRGYVQSDARAFTSTSGATGVDSFFLRRIRPVFEGTVYKYWDFKIMPDFAAGAALIQDAYVDFHYWKEASLLAGKYKEPVSLERLQSARDLIFIERSIANNLQPNRDVGVQLHGELLQGRLSYVAGAFNGVNDSQSLDGDTNNDKDFAGRIFAQPWKNDRRSVLQGLGFGVAGSIGGETDSLSATALKTTGRSTFYKYASGVSGGGDRTRFSPQFFYFRGPLGLMGEYLVYTQDVVKGAKRAALSDSGYFLQASYVLTGEKASYTGVVPRHNFDPKQGKFGAVELAARYSRLDFDPEAFHGGFADPAASARSAGEFTFGVNWYFNPLVKLQLNYAHTEFNRALKFGTEKLDHEDVFLSRFQVAF